MIPEVLKKGDEICNKEDAIEYVNKTNKNL